MVRMVSSFGQGHFRYPAGAPSSVSFVPAWQDLRLGAGGQITSISILNQTVAGVAADGTTLIRTDTGGAYLYLTSGSSLGPAGNDFAAPCWRQLFTTASIPVADQTYQRLGSGNVGCVEIIASQSSPNIAYALWNGFLYVTTNLKSQSIIWTKTTQTTTGGANVGGTKGNSPYIYIDPNNPNIVYYSTPSLGVFKSVNGLLGAGATWAQVSAVGTATSSQGHIFAVDPASTVVGGVTQHFWIATFGTGVYETTNGGTSYTLTTSGPTAFYHMGCDKFSQLWLVDQGNGLKRYASGSWSTLTPPTIGSGGPTCVAFDPTSAAIGTNHVIIGSFDGDLADSSDNGATWTGFFSNQTFSATGSQPGSLGTMSQTSGGAVHLNTLNIATDASGNVWNAGGVGVWTTPAPVAISATPWSANAVGIEQLVVNQVISPPNNSPLTAAWDRGVYLNANPDIYPSSQYPNSTSINQIQGGWGIDYASAGGTKNFVIAWIQSNLDSTNAPSSSSNGGATWTVWAGLPGATFFGGNVAASTATNWITVPGRNEQIYFTSNGGSTWTASTISGSPTNWLFDTNEGVIIAADRVTSGNFCAVNRSQAFFKSTDGGASFTATGATSANVDGAANLAFLKSAPGNAGHYYYTAGGNGAATDISLWKSTDSCVTFANVNSNLKPVYNFGFGAAKPGGSGYPTIYVDGALSGVFGIYQSIDAGATWTACLIPSEQFIWPQRTADFVQDMSGDASVYGRIYVGFNGTGAAYVDTQDACPWVNFSNTNPNAALTGTVTLTAKKSGLVPVKAVQFSVDGVNIGSPQTGVGPYSVSWNTSSVANGSHTLVVTTLGTNGSASFSIPVTTS